MTADRVRVLGAPVDNLTMGEAVARACDLVEARGAALGTTLNADILRHYDENARFRTVFESADMILMDGAPLQMLSGRMGEPVKEKVSGPDFMPMLCAAAAERGYRCFILGGRDGVPDAAAAELRRLVPGLSVCGTLSPDFGFEKDDSSSRGVVERVRAASPDILFVCLGTPKSELWIDEWRAELDVPLSFSLGAAVDFLAGKVKRAPRWMSDGGLEWLFRISQDPGRLFGRYAKDAAFLVSAVIHGGEVRK